jgi:hypothetical protein
MYANLMIEHPEAEGYYGADALESPPPQDTDADPRALDAEALAVGVLLADAHESWWRALTRREDAK